MKLSEAKTAMQGGPAPYLQTAFSMLKRIKPDAELNHLAWFAAIQDASLLNDNITKENAWLFYEGIAPYKDNPQKINDYFESVLYSDADYEMLEQELKDFFSGGVGLRG